MNKRKAIFIIDDDINLCLLLKTYFLRKHYNVNIAHSFGDALSHVKDFQPDIVFLRTAICQNADEDVIKLKEEVPNAEIVLDNYTIPNDH